MNDSARVIGGKRGKNKGVRGRQDRYAIEPIRVSRGGELAQRKGKSGDRLLYAERKRNSISRFLKTKNAQKATTE